MAAWSFSLVLFSCLFVLHIAIQTNIEPSRPWITYRGCYYWMPGSRNKSLSNNGPTNCFRECANYTHIGIQRNTCICFENMPSTPRKYHYFCQLSSQSDHHMRLFSKVIELPDKISQADYGYVYVSIPSFEFQASHNISEVHGVCYEDNTLTCKCCNSGSSAINGEEANRTRLLVSYLDFNNSCHMPPYGDYWIGMFRETQVFSSTAQTAPSTYTSSLLLSSTQQTFPSLDSTSTSFTQTVSVISSTNKSTESTKTQIYSASPNTDITPSSQNTNSTTYPEGKPEDTWEITAIAFIAISVALMISIIAGLVAFLRRKKENQISDHKNEPASGVGDTEQLETDKRSQNSLPLRLELHEQFEGNHTLERKTKHRKNSEDGQPDQTVQNPAILEKKKHRKSHHREKTDGANLASTAVEHNPEIREKKRKHRKSHHHEETVAINLSGTNVEHNFLDNLEHNNKKKKKKSKRKKRKNKNANTS